MELLGVSFLLFVLIAVPLLIVVGGMVMGTAIKQYFHLQRERLRLDRDRFERDVEIRRLTNELPPWLDIDDPMELAAWRGAIRETVSLSKKSYSN